MATPQKFVQGNGKKSQAASTTAPQDKVATGTTPDMTSLDHPIPLDAFAKYELDIYDEPKVEPEGSLRIAKVNGSDNNYR